MRLKRSATKPHYCDLNAYHRPRSFDVFSISMIGKAETSPATSGVDTAFRGGGGEGGACVCVCVQKSARWKSVVSGSGKALSR